MGSTNLQVRGENNISTNKKKDQLTVGGMQLLSWYSCPACGLRKPATLLSSAASLAWMKNPRNTRNGSNASDSGLTRSTTIRFDWSGASLYS